MPGPQQVQMSELSSMLHARASGIMCTSASARVAQIVHVGQSALMQARLPASALTLRGATLAGSCTDKPRTHVIKYV